MKITKLETVGEAICFGFCGGISTRELNSELDRLTPSSSGSDALTA